MNWLRECWQFLLYCILLVLALCLFLFVAMPRLTRSEQKNFDQFKVNTEESIIKNLNYSKDPRTGLCFGYAWVGNYHGGPALTEVPCEKVEQLLK